MSAPLREWIIQRQAPAGNWRALQRFRRVRSGQSMYVRRCPPRYYTFSRAWSLVVRLGRPRLHRLLNTRTNECVDVQTIFFWLGVTR